MVAPAEKDSYSEACEEDKNRTEDDYVTNEFDEEVQVDSDVTPPNRDSQTARTHS